MSEAFTSREVLPGDFPGYAEAVARENLIRGAACLGLNEKICGLEVLPLTAFHYRRLMFMRSPFLLKDITAHDLAGTPEKKFADGKPDLLTDIMNFLWLVSPIYSEGSKTSPVCQRWKKLFSVGRASPRAETPRDKFNITFAPILKSPVDRICAEILEYIEEAFIDAEESDDGDAKNYYAFEISIAQEFRKHYGFRIDFWNPDCPRALNPLHVPLKLVYQFRKLRTKLNDPKSPVSNRSEKFISDGLQKMGGNNRLN